MTALLTGPQMQQLDRIAIEEIGIPSLVLMEVAGRAVLDAALELWEEAPGAVLVLAGTGNNGADAVVVARHLCERGVDVDLVVCGQREKASEDMAHQLRVVEALGLTPIFRSGADAVSDIAARVGRASVVVEGLFGTGLDRPVEGWRVDVIHALNAGDAPVVAVDMPAGIDANTGQVLGVAVDADVTVTFQCAKIGQALYPGRGHAGDIRVADIGIPTSRLPDVGAFASLVDDRILQEAFPPRVEDSHKGTYGHVLVVAGAPDRPGSALLAARAAQRTGAGLVTVGSDAETVRRLAGALGSLMGLTVGDDRVDASRVLEALESRTALMVGPSLPGDDRTLGFLKEVLTRTRVPAVLDAGALVALGTDNGWLAERRGPTVLTPHPGEMARLMGTDARGVQSDRVGAARAVAEATGATVVLKGASTVVADEEGRVGIVVRGNPGMATGGSGDVLAGMLASLLGQGVAPFLAARAGAHLHALAADIAAESTGHAGLTPEDIIDAIGPAIRRGQHEA